MCFREGIRGCQGFVSRLKKVDILAVRQVFLLLCCFCVRGVRFDASESCENELMARRRGSC